MAVFMRMTVYPDQMVVRMQMRYKITAVNNLKIEPASFMGNTASSKMAAKIERDSKIYSLIS